MPAPARGALVKRWAELLSEHQDDLATLVSIEAGKITSESLGEVQEAMNDASWLDCLCGVEKNAYCVSQSVSATAP